MAGCLLFELVNLHIAVLSDAVFSAGATAPVHRRIHSAPMKAGARSGKTGACFLNLSIYERQRTKDVALVSVSGAKGRGSPVLHPSPYQCLDTIKRTLTVAKQIGETGINDRTKNRNGAPTYRKA